MGVKTHWKLPPPPPLLLPMLSSRLNTEARRTGAGPLNLGPLTGVGR